MIYQRGTEGKTYKVGFTRPRKNGRRRHFATLKAGSPEEATKLFKDLLYDPEVETDPGKYELCTGDWEVILTDNLL